MLIEILSKNVVYVFVYFVMRSLASALALCVLDKSDFGSEWSGKNTF